VRSRIYHIKVAAGQLSDEQIVSATGLENLGADDNDSWAWVEQAEHIRPARDLFVAQVVGASMNRRIADGAWCLWRFTPAGPWTGKVVLAEHREIQDSDLGGHSTVKLYHSESAPRDSANQGKRLLTRVILSPDSQDKSFQPIVLEGLQENELRIIAELVEVLG